MNFNGCRVKDGRWSPSSTLAPTSSPIFHGKLLVHRKNMRLHPRLSNQPKKAGLAGECSQLHLKQRRAPNLPRLRPQRQRLQAGTPTPRVDLSSATGTETNGPSTCRGRDSNQPTLPSPNPCAQHLSVMPESSLSVRPGRFSATRGLSRRSSVHGLSSPETTNLMLNYFIASNMLIISMCRTYTVTTTTRTGLRHT